MSIQHQHIYSTYIYFQNCLQHISDTKIYFEIYIFSNHVPDLHSSPQLLAWYIQYQHIYSTDIYSPNCWQHIFNTNIYFNKFIFPNTAPKGRTETPTIHAAPKCRPDISNTHVYIQLTFIPQIVGCIYPITNLIFFKCERHTRRSCVVKEQSRPIYMCIHAFSEFPPFWTVLCCKHNTFTFSMFDHGLNGHPNKIPTHISLKWSYICFWYWK